ncbi:NnrS family protein [Phaeobacter sp. JH18-32]|uniref:NnrS family protein n=1 Tax=Phaeobacter TaxID=302485 RepID=UPI003A869B09
MAVTTKADAGNSTTTLRTPPILSYGFRPFFLLATLWAGLAMIAWIGLLGGTLTLPLRLDPVSWHAKTFLFGYLSAVLAGFLLTAVPNWTGRAPLTGGPLLALVLLWMVGRLVTLCGAFLPVWTVTLVDVSFPLMLGAVVLREIIAGKNWRNLVILLLLAIHALALILLHLETAAGGYPAQGLGLRLGLANAIGMICLIGGRIIPSFTRNWLVKQGADVRPADPMQSLDKIALALSLPTLAIWVAVPDHIAAAAALAIFGVAQMLRLVRWQGHHTGAEPLLGILHLAYAMIPIGALLMASIRLLRLPLDPASAQHLWMAGAIGIMTLAVMIRATLGHTGRPLVAGAGTRLLLLAIIIATFARLVANSGSDIAHELYLISAIAWCIAFFGFALLFGRALVSTRRPATDT